MRFGPGQRALAILACVALGSACSSSSSNPTPTGTPTPSPSPTTSGGATSTPIAATNGVAYIPDGGLTPGFTGVYVVHFEDTSAHLLPSGGATAAPTIVTFPGAVGPLAFSADATTSVAALGTTTGAPFSFVQDVFGLSNASLVPVGSPYNAAIPPSPPSSPNPTPTPNASQVVSNITGASIIGLSSLGVALTVGPASSGLLGVSSLTAAPPTFGGFVPFSNGTVSPPAGNAFYNVEVSADDAEVLVRGPNALEVFTITFPQGTFQFTNPMINTSLGTAAGPVLGRGAMAINPGSSGTVLLAQAPAANSVQYLSGLPAAITKGMTVALASTPRSIAITNPVSGSAGNLAVVGTDGGFYVLSGVLNGLLVVNKAYLAAGADGLVNSPLYVGCDGKPHALANVTSIGLSPDNRFVAALAHVTGSSCGSLVAVPLSDTSVASPAPTATPSPGATATPTPAPTLFVQNNLPVPSPNTDYMRVR